MTSPAETDVAPRRLNEPSFPFQSILFVLIVGLFIAARLWRLTTSCLWFDEIFCVHATRLNWKPMFQFVAADLIHPPLFYVSLKLWIAIGGESLLWLRLLPVVLSVAAIVPIVLLCRELKLNVSQINLTLGLLAVNGYLIKYAQEVRMYSLLFLLGCISLWLFVKYINAQEVRWLWLWLTVVNLLLVYSHYYGWILIFVELLLLILWWREKIRKFVWTLFALIFSYLPWLHLLTIAREPGRGLAQNIGWVSRPGIKDLLQFFAFLNTPFFFRKSLPVSAIDFWSIGLSLLVFGLPLAILIWRSMKRETVGNRSVWMLFSFAMLPIVVAFALSWIFPYSVWGTRHLIVAAVPYAMLAALALSKLEIAWLRTTCLILIACWILLNGTLMVATRPTTLTWCNWEPLAGQVVAAEKNNTEPIDVYAFEDLVAYHLWFAFQNAERLSEGGKFRVHVVKGIPGLLEDPSYFLPRRFYDVETQAGGTLRGSSVWLAFRDLQWNPARPPLNMIAAQDFETGRIFELQAQGQKSFLVELRRKGQTR